MWDIKNWITTHGKGAIQTFSDRTRAEIARRIFEENLNYREIMALDRQVREMTGNFYAELTHWALRDALRRPWMNMQDPKNHGALGEWAYFWHEETCHPELRLDAGLIFLGLLAEAYDFLYAREEEERISLDFSRGELVELRSLILLYRQGPLKQSPEHRLACNGTNLFERLEELIRLKDAS
jgi:hypothetical protein